MSNSEPSVSVTATPVQRTLTNEPTDEGRTRPETMLWCPTTEQFVLRRRRDEWPHDLESLDEYREQQQRDKLPDDCQVLTQEFEVEFVYEYREVVTVEAAEAWEAKEQAKEVNLQNPEYMDTLHTEVETLGEPSKASLDYLQDRNLIPDGCEVDDL